MRSFVLRPTRSKFQLHNYLTHHDGKYWCLFSHGPVVEDVPTQFISYATSDDGLKWSEAKPVMPAPKEPYAYIARGLWLRDGELLALAAHFRDKGAFGVNKELKLVAYAWDKAAGEWKFQAKLFDDAINNFAPQKLQNGEWLMTRRDARFNVYMLAGGVKALDDWQSFPVVKRLEVPKFARRAVLVAAARRSAARTVSRQRRLEPALPGVLDGRRPDLDATADHELPERVEQVLPVAAVERPLGDDLERQSEGRPSRTVSFHVGGRPDVHEDGPARDPVGQGHDVPVPARHRARRPPADRLLAKEDANRSLQSAAVDIDLK